ncbi:MAG: hypothetical protein NZ845_01010, partial [Thermodesulfovibrio sp.]|nr:hypothetical protein [Thermodesulfovibrio sp.]
MANENVNIESSKVDFSELGASVKRGIIGGLKCVNDIENEIVNLVKNTVSTALKTSSSLAT